MGALEFAEPAQCQKEIGSCQREEQEAGLSSRRQGKDGREDYNPHHTGIAPPCALMHLLNVTGVLQGLNTHHHRKPPQGGKKNHKTEKRAIGMVPMGPVPLRAEKVGARLSRKWARREEIL